MVVLGQLLLKAEGTGLKFYILLKKICLGVVLQIIVIALKMATLLLFFMECINEKFFRELV